VSKHASEREGSTIIPHKLPCEFHIRKEYGMVQDSCHEYVTDLYVNNNYIKFFQYCSTQGFSIYMMRKDGDVISYHTGWGSSHSSENKTQADLDSFIVAYLSDYIKTYICDRVYDVVVNGENMKICHVTDTVVTNEANYTFDKNNFLVAIEKYQNSVLSSNFTMTYDFNCSADHFTMYEHLSGSRYYPEQDYRVDGCDDIAYTVPTEGLCQSNSEDWELYIDFDGMDSCPSESVISDAMQDASEVVSSKMRIELNSENGCKVTIYFNDEALARIVRSAVVDCLTPYTRGECADIFRYVKTATLVKKGGEPIDPNDDPNDDPKEGSTNSEARNCVHIMSILLLITAILLL